MAKIISVLLIVFFILLVTASIFLVGRDNTKQTQPSSSITATTISQTQSKTKQTTWKVQDPANHTYVSDDNMFQFVYPQDWSYETIDGNIPAQQHIVQMGRRLTQNERAELAQKAGIPLSDSLGSISYTSADITLYYTNTTEFRVQNAEELATGTILSKKQITVGNTPALEVRTDCPTECIEVLFVKGQQTFTFLMARPRGETTPLDTTKLNQIISTFTFLQ